MAPRQIPKQKTVAIQSPKMDMRITQVPVSVPKFVTGPGPVVGKTRTPPPITPGLFVPWLPLGLGIPGGPKQKQKKKKTRKGRAVQTVAGVVLGEPLLGKTGARFSGFEFLR
jgi:hypothetical protein